MRNERNDDEDQVWLRVRRGRVGVHVVAGDRRPKRSGVALKTEVEDLEEAETDYDELLNKSEFPEVKGLWWFQAYPVEGKYSFFKGWGGGEATELLELVKELSKKG